MTTSRYTLISGDFHILYPDLPRNGPEPDGDTVNFQPDLDELVWQLPRFDGQAPDRRHLGNYGVRFEGIDALETHFQNQHQDLEFALGARDHLLAGMGFGRIEFWPDRPAKVKSAEHHPVRGFLLANGIEANGRILALSYVGDPARRDPALTGGLPADAADGDSVFVTPEVLDASLNAEQVRTGLAYAELYSTMPLELITRMRALTATARGAGAGMWTHEDLSTEHRVDVHGLVDLSKMVIFPKLYRRLVAYFKDTGRDDLSAFDAWLRGSPDRDDRALLPDGELGNLHDLYEIDAEGMRLRHRPEDLVFL